MGATLNAAVLNVTKEGGTESSAFGSMLAPGATLINTETQGVIIYDENMIPPLSAPFDLSHGVGYKGFTLSGSLPTTGETLKLDFTSIYQINFSYILSESAVGYDENQNAYPLDYVVLTFDNANFAEWYTETPMSITATFNGGTEATAYVIQNTCDRTDADTTYGGLVFFNSRVRTAAEESEQFPSAASVPEPTTATLSLLALAGLAARRRR